MLRLAKCTRFGSEAYTLKGFRLVESCWNGRLQLSISCTSRRALTYNRVSLLPHAAELYCTVRFRVVVSQS